MKNCKYGFRAVAPSLVFVAGLLSVTGPGFATEQSQQRQQARDTRQDARQQTRDTKAECRAGDEKNRAECRQDKRDTKQDARQKGRDIKY